MRYAWAILPDEIALLKVENRLLADEIFETAWAVATSKNGVRHKNLL